ncbi:MAG: M23 family metallopeptidase [Quisquiliibacterium sp.]
MQIIILHSRLSRARSLTLRPAWLVALGLGLVLAIGLGGIGLSYLALKNIQDLPAAWLPDSLIAESADIAPQSGSVANPVRPLVRNPTEVFVRQNIDALAVRLGELQARLTRLDAIGERVGGLLGLGVNDSAGTIPGRGGALPSISQPLSMSELSSEIDRVGRLIERRDEQLGLVESEIVLRQTMARLLPSSHPLDGALPGSRFGWRIDPFDGRRAMHEGIDFTAPTGTPIVAAGAGVVVFAAWHPQYGRMVEIDHGEKLVTRYAHASKLLVKVGDIVHRGERIALVGSTGRSTGPHLHFEVRVDDKPRDPLVFLRQSQSAARLADTLGMNLTALDKAR